LSFHDEASFASNPEIDDWRPARLGSGSRLKAESGADPFDEALLNPVIPPRQEFRK
jgi:hypothetical protein